MLFHFSVHRLLSFAINSNLSLSPSRVKGSDASWLNDIEPPPHQVDYSDDEEERRAKRQSKQARQGAGAGEEAAGDEERGQRKMLEARRQRPSESSSRWVFSSV